MKKTLFLSSAVCIVLAGSMLFSACNKGGGINSEETALVVSSEALDGVFNPFFYTTGPDGEVVGQTQIGMLTTDADGNLVCGENEACVALDYATETTGSKTEYETTGSYENYYTEYWFAVKNGIKFSDGSDLTIDDVIFSLYVLLDPAYTGFVHAVFHQHPGAYGLPHAGPRRRGRGRKPGERILRIAGGSEDRRHHAVVRRRRFYDGRPDRIG